MTSCKRKITYENFNEYKTIKITHDNSIFEDIKYKLNDYQKQQLEDFLDIFYYLIINYSKNCYKYNATWEPKSKTWNKKFIPNFDYDGANKCNSHNDLLKIQRQMFIYRDDYRKYLTPKNNIFTIEFINKFTNFINESLHIFYVSVIEPLKYINPNILTKLQYHNEIYKSIPKKSNKINYNVLEELISTGQINSI